MSYLRQISPWTRAMLAVLALAGAAIAVTVATASGADSAGSDSAAPGDVTFAPGLDPDIIEEFESCMSDHGVDVPEPGERFEGPRGVHEPTDEEREAFEACEEKLPRPPHGAVMLAPRPDSEAFEEFRDCMSEHGADVPKRPPHGGERRLDEPSAEEREAFEACGDQLPAPPPGVCPPPGAPPALGMSDDD